MMAVVRQGVSASQVGPHRGLQLGQPDLVIRQGIIIVPLVVEERQPDISLAGERLGWKPLIGLEAGLAETAKYFAARIGC